MILILQPVVPPTPELPARLHARRAAAKGRFTVAGPVVVRQAPRRASEDKHRGRRTSIALPIDNRWSAVIRANLGDV